MKTLYLECAMGAAGDMIMSALYELLDDKKAFLEKMNALGLGEVNLEALPVSTCGIVGTRIAVSIGGEEERSQDHHEHSHHEHDHGAHDHGAHDGTAPHSHASIGDVRGIIKDLPLPETVISNAFEVYDDLAKAEARVHGAKVNMVHFHEVGALDAIADIVGVCYAIYLIDAKRIIASPIRTGFGHVHCAHGVVPVPAPATAELLKGLPCYAGDICGEMCTPTGAALLRHFVQEFGEKPMMTTDAIGYGVGKKDFGGANCVRAFLGETEDKLGDEIYEIVCNIDDMTAEALSYAMERIMESGALDVSAVPATMKKGRAGHILTVMARIDEEQEVAKTILRETTTNGVRINLCRRMKLKTGIDTVNTKYGPVRVKRAEGYGICRAKPEYDDISAIAREKALPFAEVLVEAMNNVR
ncbi:MAG: nickel pincer cofactor biosynthesis protein LarC [Oscillospiraceae bacterium]